MHICEMLHAFPWHFAVSAVLHFEGKGREGKGREGKGREGKGREGKGREGKGRGGEGRGGTLLAVQGNCLMYIIL